jgi:hypothetical protein
MTFNNRSNLMLKYEKSKSKLIEFSIAKKDYPHFPLNSNDLTYTTLFVLSRFCEEIIEDSNSKLLDELKSELVLVSQYYDVTVKTQHRQNYNNLFLLLGATAYFLADNFGSAKVLISQIDEWSNDNIIMTLLYVTLNYLLTGHLLFIKIEDTLCNVYWKEFRYHFENGHSPRFVFNVLEKLRTRIYKSTDILAFNYIDFLFATVICAINHSAWILLPKYSKNDSNQWANYLSRKNSIKLLWPAQKVILEAGVLTGKDIVVPLPTGVGKTKSIEILLRAKFMEEENTVAVIIAPLRALCNEISTDLATALNDEVIINQFTDISQKDFNLELGFNTKHVFICTPEKFSYILRHEPNFLESIQLFIFDEAHLFDDSSRGVQYELLISEIARERKSITQMVLFSAVLSNASQISEWLFGDKTAIIDNTLVKSTEKSIGFLSSDQSIHYYEKDNMLEESFFVPKSIKIEELNPLNKERKPRFFPEKDPKEIAIYYAVKLCLQGGSAIYAGQVRSILPIMRKIVELNERQYNLSSLSLNGNSDEITKLSYLLKVHYGADFEIVQAAKVGAFPHYAYLPTGIKLAIEHALRKQHISFVVCTTTLAEGVNIPIKYLFLTTFNLGISNIQIRKMQNMVGRTARSGIHTEGSAIVTDATFYDEQSEIKGGGKHKWKDCKKMFDYGSAEACSSAILSLVSILYIDYENSISASTLVNYILKYYALPNCFANLTDSILTAYKEEYIITRYNRYAPEIAQKIAQLKHTIESIENYLCYIYNINNNHEQFIETVNLLVEKTFAYFLGDNYQKQSLILIFQQIAQKIITFISPEKATYFAKSLYGIDISNQILCWVDKNVDYFKEISEEELTEYIAKFFIELFPELVKVEIEIFLSILELWIMGKSYIDIYDNLNTELSISKIEKLCSNTISYHLCFLIGNILAAIDEQEEELIECITLLQKKIKYGVPDLDQILICENLFDDRILSEQISSIISQYISTEKNLKRYLLMQQEQITQILKVYPDYFTFRFHMYIK